MRLWIAFFVLILCASCQSGKIPCPEPKYAKMKASRAGKTTRYFAPPSMVASTKSVENTSPSRQQVDLDRLRANRTTGKQMLEQYGNVDEWDCPSPSEKRKYSKVTKDNIRRNEKRMREHMKHTEPDSTSLIPLRGTR